MNSETPPGAGPPLPGGDGSAAGLPTGPPADPPRAESGDWPPWRVWEPLGAIAVLALSQLALGLLLGGLLPRLRPEAAGRQIGLALPVLVVGSHAITWAAVLWILRRRRCGFRSALRIAETPGRWLLKSYGAGLGLYLILLPVLALFPPPPDQTNLFTEIFRRGGATLVLLLVTAVLLAPALEETLFRGLLLPALRRQWKFWPAAVVVTAVFTGLHVAQTGAYLPALAGIFACGLALAWLREQTGSLWPAIAFHMGFNSTPFLVWLLALPFGGLNDGPLG